MKRKVVEIEVPQEEDAPLAMPLPLMPYTVPQVCKFLRRGQTAVYDLLKDGQLLCYKPFPGKTLVYGQCIIDLMERELKMSTHESYLESSRARREIGKKRGRRSAPDEFEPQKLGSSL